VFRRQQGVHPESIWPEVRDRTVAIMKDIKMGDVTDFRNFMGAVIDKRAFTKIGEYLDSWTEERDCRLRRSSSRRRRILHRADTDRDKGPGYRLLCEEIFGPVVTAHVYPDNRWEETLRIVDETSPYALTGAIFSRDRSAIREAALALRNAAGNFYINDKPTGAVGGSATVRRRAWVGHERQGRIEAESRALDQSAEYQRDFLAADRLSLPVHVRGIASSLSLLDPRRGQSEGVLSGATLACRSPKLRCLALLGRGSSPRARFEKRLRGPPPSFPVLGSPGRCSHPFGPFGSAPLCGGFVQLPQSAAARFMAERFTSGAIYGSHRATSPWTVIAGTKRMFPL